MKTIVALLLALSGFVDARREVPQSDWQWAAPFAVEKPGIVRLELPPEVLDASRPDLGDLRVRRSEGEHLPQTPYLIEAPVRGSDTARDAPGFKVALSGRSTIIEVSPEPSGPIQAVYLVSPARDFLKSVSIEGQLTGGEWQTLASSEVIFRQADGAERLRFPLPEGAWNHLRFTVDDERSRPVPFTGVRVMSPTKKPDTVELPVSVKTREEAPSETRLTLDLGARNLDVTDIHLDIPDALFSRNCSLGFSTPSPDGGTRMEGLGTTTVYRVSGDRNISAEDLVIPVNRRIPSRYLVATIRNGDSPPLKVTGAKVRYCPTILTFYADVGGRWLLFTGNPAEKAPAYDLNALRGALSHSAAQRVVPDSLRKDPDYIPPPIFPAVETVGTPIDLAKWSRSRRVFAETVGVIRIELDAKVLAGCREDLGDLRLVQNGNQIPYLVRPLKITRDLKPTAILLQSDPKRPTVSRWEITLPVDGLPAANLTASSSASLFTRRFVASDERKDPLGNAGTGIVGAADWIKSGESQPPLSLDLRGVRLPRTFVVETDHGDNPPVPVDDFVVRFAAPSITAKLANASPLFLCYGNPDASPPKYDLRLVWNDLIAADQQATVLGEEEILRPDASKPTPTDSGSPWLWLALGGVVVALLVVVAKLLPKPAEE